MTERLRGEAQKWVLSEKKIKMVVKQIIIRNIIEGKPDS